MDSDGSSVGGRSRLNYIVLSKEGGGRVHGHSFIMCNRRVGLDCSLTCRASNTAEWDSVSSFAKQDGKPLVVDAVDIVFNGEVVGFKKA